MADYPTAVLEKHWPDVPRWRDIRTLTKEGFYAEDSPASRFPWPESSVGRKTSGFCGLKCSALSGSLGRIASSVRTYLESSALPPGRWSRIWSVKAITSSCLILKLRLSELGTGGQDAFFVGIDDLSDAESLGQQGDRTDGEPERGARSATEKYEGLRAVCDTLPGRRDWDGRRWAVEPGVGRVADGLPCRVDRIRALGNAVVPQQAYPVFRALAEELNRRDNNGN